MEESNLVICPCCKEKFIDYEAYYVHDCQHTYCDCEIKWVDPDEN